MKEEWWVSARYRPSLVLLWSSRWKRLVGFVPFQAMSSLMNILQVTRLTTSMLLQRLPSAEPTVEAAIAYNLVDLALTAPRSPFCDIIKAFSAINRSANPDDPRFSNNMVRNLQVVAFS